MKLSRSKLASVLSRRGIQYRQDPEGFLLSCGWTLRSGSGIAGQENRWFGWNIQTNRLTDKTATNIRELDEMLKTMFIGTCGHFDQD